MVLRGFLGEKTFLLFFFSRRVLVLNLKFYTSYSWRDLHVGYPGGVVTLVQHLVLVSYGVYT